LNSTQIQNTLAPLISFLAGLLAAKVPFLDVGSWTTIIGALLGIGATIWAGFSTRNTAVISQAAALPEVQSIKLDPSASSATVAATPGNVSK